VIAAPIVAKLLEACPSLKVLVTSRVILRLQGEHVYRLDPLAVPDLGLMAAPEPLLQFAAVRLFVDRAQATRTDFVLTNENAPAVAEICVRLEGLPLAIELAAVWTRLLSPHAILDRLTPLLPLLSESERDRPARHQTMRAAIAWSYDLLDEDEKALFRRLTVFAGGFTLDAALAIGRRKEDQGVKLLSRIAFLADKSLLRRDAATRESRLGILETVREYGWERLTECGEVDSVVRDHAEFFLNYVESQGQQWSVPLKSDWLVQLEQERRNLGAALRWFIDSGDVVKGLRLAAALGPFWLTRGPLDEGLARLSELILLSEPIASDVNAPPDIRLARAHGLHWLACLERRQSDYRAARRHYGDCLAILRQIGDRQSIVSVLSQLGNVELQDGDLVAARERLEDILAHSPEIMDLRSRCYSLVNLGVVDLHAGEYVAARLHLEEALRLSRQAGDGFCMSYVLHGLGCVALGEGKLREARAHLLDAWALAVEFGDKTLIANLLEALSAVAIASSSPERAIRLAAAASFLRSAIGVAIAPVWDRWLRPRLEAAYSALSPGDYDRAWRDGQAMTSEQTAVYAMEEGPIS
jgi:non-specific serine/threonine protein kinase